MNRYLRFLGLLLFAYILYRIDLPQLARAFRGANPWMLLLGTLLAPPIIAAKAERWRLLLASQGIHYRRWPAILAYFAGTYLGVVTPGRVGDLIKVAYLRGDLGVSLARGVTSAIADRLLDLYLLAAVGLIACLYFQLAISWVALGVLALLVVLPAVAMAPGVAERVLRRVFERSLARRLRRLGGVAGARTAMVGTGGGRGGEARAGAEDRLAAGATPPEAGVAKAGAEGSAAAAQFVASARQLASWRLALAAVTTCAIYAVIFVQSFVLARAFGIGLGFLDIALMTAATNLVALLPISISGVGTRDATLIYLFQLRGLPAAPAVALSMAMLICGFLSMAALGALAWQMRPPPLSRSCRDR